MRQWNREFFETLPVGAQKLIEWQFGMTGGFYTSLFHLIRQADDTNRARLRLAFPDEVDAFQQYHYVEGWWPDVMEKLTGDRDA